MSKQAGFVSIIVEIFGFSLHRTLHTFFQITRKKTAKQNKRLEKQENA